MKSFILLFLMVSPLVILNAQSEELLKELEAIGDEINEAALSGDDEKVMSHFTDDVIVYPVLNPPIKGKKAYRESLAKLRANGFQYKAISANTTEFWVCDGLAYQIGTFGVTTVMNNSAKPIAYYGSFFHVWEKQPDESYKLKYMMSNFDFNPFGK